MRSTFENRPWRYILLLDRSLGSFASNEHIYTYKPVLYLENFQGTVNGTMRVGVHVRERPACMYFLVVNQLFSTFTLPDVPFSLSQQSSPGIFDLPPAGAY